MEEKKITWRKIGGGSFRFKGAIIKPNQKFVAAPSEIPKAFRDLLIPLEDLPPREEVDTPAPVPKKVIQPSFTIRPRGNSKTWFDIINSEGKVLNEKALKKDDAEAFINDLTKQ